MRHCNCRISDIYQKEHAGKWWDRVWVKGSIPVKCFRCVCVMAIEACVAISVFGAIMKGHRCEGHMKSVLTFSGLFDSINVCLWVVWRQIMTWKQDKANKNKGKNSTKQIIIKWQDNLTSFQEHRQHTSTVLDTYTVNHMTCAVNKCDFIRS